MSERVGLMTLVERACLRWIDPSPEGPNDRIHLQEYDNLSFRGEVLRMCRAGLMSSSWWRNSEALREDLRQLSAFSPVTLRSYYSGEGDDDSDHRFWEIIAQASRLDDFLFTLECDRRCAPLARDCRDDLALLNVLADWCEDYDRPIAAAEARHLWSLVASILRE